MARSSSYSTIIDSVLGVDLKIDALYNAKSNCFDVTSVLYKVGSVGCNRIFFS